MKIQNREIYRDRKWVCGCLVLGGKEEAGTKIMMVVHIYKYPENYQIIYFMWANYISQ